MSYSRVPGPLLRKAGGHLDCKWRPFGFSGTKNSMTCPGGVEPAHTSLRYKMSLRKFTETGKGGVKNVRNLYKMSQFYYVSRLSVSHLGGCGCEKIPQRIKPFLLYYNFAFWVLSYTCDAVFPSEIKIAITAGVRSGILCGRFFSWSWERIWRESARPRQQQAAVSYLDGLR